MQGSGMRLFLGKLGRLKLAFREWNQHSFKNVFDNVKQAEEKELDLEKDYDSCPSYETLMAFNHGKTFLTYVLHEEESFWHKKQGIKWLKKGDANTFYFHRCCTERTTRFLFWKLRTRRALGPFPLSKI